MSDEWRRLEPLLERALDLKSAERARFIESVQLEDARLGGELANLVRTCEESDLGLGTLTESIRQMLREGLQNVYSRERRSLLVGEVVLERFRIVRFIGRGGMGEVYEALDSHMGRVALKTIRPDLAPNEQAMQRFRTEVQLARKITSPLVVRVHELFTVPANAGRSAFAFLTMEYLDGITLADRVARDGAFGVQAAEPIALQLCSALEAIHSAGVVHRDLKPANIMLAEREGAVCVVVMDLGLARALERASAAAAGGHGVSRPGAINGTPAYMAPEQFEGGNITAAADIYAFGLVFYFLITSESPFQGASPIVAAVRRANPPPPASSIRPGVPRGWDEVIARCIEYAPERRFRDAGEIAGALRRARSPLARLQSALGGPAIFWVAAVLLLVLAGSAIGYIGLRPPAPVSAESMEWFNRGATYLREAAYVQATRAFQHALSLDQDFALAHASLADAWGELDFTGKAQDEILRASSLEMRQRLPRRDRERIDAIRAMVTLDFPSAQRDYAAIVEHAPANEKAWSTVDLGRAYEKAGDADQALKNYGQAARLAPEEPAAFVRLGILESRRGRTADADRDFARATSLYEASSNKEGIAEIDYQRGYAASSRGDLAHAREFLDKTLHASQDISSQQLDIRALIRMGEVEDLAGNLEKCVELEHRAMRLASENKLDYWGIDAMFHLSDAYQARRDYAKAEPLISEGLRQARENQMKRLEAHGNLELASVRSGQGNPDAAIALARAALDYYRKAGFAAESVNASVLIGRSEWAKGDLKGALADARQAVQPARNSSTPLATMQVEELLGGVLLYQQEYPEALGHFQPAMQIARTIGQNLEYEQYQCADTLWRLGRYQEAKELLASIDERALTPGVKREILGIIAQMKLSRGDARGALGSTRSVLRMSDLSPEDAVDYQNVSARALAALHSIREARNASAVALAQSASLGEGQRTAESNLVAAQVALATGAPEEARVPAEAARAFFAGSGQKESEFRSLACLARVMKSSGDHAASAKLGAQALDILAGLEQEWGKSTFQTYISRSDLHAERDWLLAAANH